MNQPCKQGVTGELRRLRLSSPTKPFKKTLGTPVANLNHFCKSSVSPKPSKVEGAEQVKEEAPQDIR